MSRGREEEVKSAARSGQGEDEGPGTVVSAPVPPAPTFPSSTRGLTGYMTPPTSRV